MRCLQFLALAALGLATLLPGCRKQAPETQHGEIFEYSSYKDIPGITEEEIKALEELKGRGVSFVYGALPGTETFVDHNGEIKGFTVKLCDWLTGLFGLPFEPKLYTWGEILAGLESGEIDFTGELTATEERHEIYYMTDAIAERLVKSLRISGSEPLGRIAAKRPLRYAFLKDTTTVSDVSAQIGEAFETFLVDSYEEAYGLLKSGRADAFLDEGTCEAAFDVYGDVTAEDFFPLIYGPVSLATRKRANAPVIGVVQKALRRGGLRRLTEFYNEGLREYRKHKLFLRLSPEERAWLENVRTVKYAQGHENYPVSFYNAHTGEWEGIAADVVREVESLTGLAFKRVSDEHTDWPALVKMLEDGEASVISELVRTPEREGRFLWPKAPIMTDRYALLSKSDFRHISVNEILYVKVGLAEGYAPTELFKKWFPNHLNTITYETFDLTFDALIRGEVDMVMSNLAQILVLTNFREMPGYKANVIFGAPFEATFGFNRDEAVLCSIVDKALGLIDAGEIAGQWKRRTYDYRKEMAQAQRLWLGGAIVMLLFIMTLLFVLFQRSRREGIRLIAHQKVVMETIAELVESRDGETGGHIERTSGILRIMLAEMTARGLFKGQTASWNIGQMVLSAQLHDVGKIAIADDILRKPGKLTRAEGREMEKHALIGGEIIERIMKKTSENEFLEYARIFALHHHERWDGLGYPQGLKGGEIPLPARLMAIIDVYDALISKRPYKEPLTHEEALKIISEGRGTQFDPVLTDLFLSVAARFV
ncbi:MAG: transporter substrate-binding domain-containing protein, partial [Candidatus Adiutrix sp.]|nr:transporter substrate-binding domain-containing protein [Candidatus Adiutrix sp.]